MAQQTTSRDKELAEIAKLYAETDEIRSRFELRWRYLWRYFYQAFILAGVLFAAWWSYLKEFSSKKSDLADLKEKIADYQVRQKIIEQDSLVRKIAIYKDSVRLERKSHIAALEATKKALIKLAQVSDSVTAYKLALNKPKQEVIIKREVVTKYIEKNSQEIKDDLLRLKILTNKWHFTTMRYNQLFNFQPDGTFSSEAIYQYFGQPLLKGTWSIKNQQLLISFMIGNDVYITSSLSDKITSNTITGKIQYNEVGLVDWKLELVK